VRRQVKKYLDEIIPHFNVLSYLQVGYSGSRKRPMSTRE